VCLIFLKFKVAASFHSMKWPNQVFDCINQRHFFIMNPFQQLFDKQKAYFATDVTKSYAWRMDQLDRLEKLLIVRLKKFTEIDD
jgi:hypothetical protein